MSRARRKAHDLADRIDLMQRFIRLTEELPGEGFLDDEITDAMVKALCDRVGDKKELVAIVEDISAIWFDDEN